MAGVFIERFHCSQIFVVYSTFQRSFSCDARNTGESDQQLITGLCPEDHRVNVAHGHAHVPIIPFRFAREHRRVTYKGTVCCYHNSHLPSPLPPNPPPPYQCVYIKAKISMVPHFEKSKTHWSVKQLYNNPGFTTFYMIAL